jgi:hypothetical protein
MSDKNKQSNKADEDTGKGTVYFELTDKNKYGYINRDDNTTGEVDTWNESGPKSTTVVEEIKSAQKSARETKPDLSKVSSDV